MAIALMLGVLFAFTPSADAPPAIHVCVAWEYRPITVPCHTPTRIAECTYMQGPRQIPCSIGGTLMDFPDPPLDGITMATVYAVWP